MDYLDLKNGPHRAFGMSQEELNDHIFNIRI